MVESRSRDPQLASDWSVPRAVNRWRRCVMRSLVRTERKYKYGAHIICSGVRVGGLNFYTVAFGEPLLWPAVVQRTILRESHLFRNFTLLSFKIL